VERLLPALADSDLAVIGEHDQGPEGVRDLREVYRSDKNSAYSWSDPGFAVQTHPDTLTVPYRWRVPRTVFANSMYAPD
jgi:hypothetical protein